jgi:hypothetical protein
MTEWFTTFFEGAAFAVDALYGDIDEVPFDIGAPRLLVVARPR